MADALQVPVDPIEEAERQRQLDRQLSRAYRNFQRYRDTRFEPVDIDFVSFALVFFNIPTESTLPWLQQHHLPIPLPEPTEKR